MPGKSWDKLFDQYTFDLDTQYNCKLPVYPPKNCVFRAFEIPVDRIKIVLLGQDPYHGPGQAHGLSFSVPAGIPIPPSLRNIYKELQNEFPERNYTFGSGIDVSKTGVFETSIAHNSPCFQQGYSGDLSQWAERGIFLLNAALTVEEGRPNSHADIWTEFTDDVIKYIVDNNEDCIFLLLGNYAKTKDKFIKNKKRIVYGVHPSPLSAHRGFFNSGIFKEVEDKLGAPFDWSI